MAVLPLNHLNLLTTPTQNTHHQPGQRLKQRSAQLLQMLPESHRGGFKQIVVGMLGHLGSRQRGSGNVCKRTFRLAEPLAARCHGQSGKHYQQHAASHREPPIAYERDAIVSGGKRLKIGILL
mgnify:CR=1 FL=1